MLRTVADSTRVRRPHQRVVLTQLSLALLALPALAADPSAGKAADPAKPAASTAKPAAPTAKSAASTAKPATSAGAAAVPAGGAAEPQVAPHLALCEVELSGQMQGTLPAGLTYWVYVADGDCLAKNAQILGTMRGSETGGFNIEVFSRQGADLTVCGAAAKTPESPTTLYGKLGRKLHAQGQGEVIFEKLQLTLKPGPAHTVPKAKGS